MRLSSPNHNVVCCVFLPDKPEDRVNYNDKPPFTGILSTEHDNYERVAANNLEAKPHSPRRVKALLRDFIEDPSRFRILMDTSPNKSISISSFLRAP